MGFAHPGGAQEKEGTHGTPGVPQPHPAALDGPGHLPHRLLLAHDAPLELLAEVQAAVRLLRLHLLHPDAGGLGDYRRHRLAIHLRGGTAATGGQLQLLEAQAGSRLVNKVDGLIRQVTVGEIPPGKGDGGVDGLIGDTHPMVPLVPLPQPPQNPLRVLRGGLLHQDALEPPLQGTVLFDGAAKLPDGGGPDELELPPGQLRL